MVSRTADAGRYVPGCDRLNFDASNQDGFIRLTWKYIEALAIGLGFRLIANKEQGEKNTSLNDSMGLIPIERRGFPCR